MLSESSRGGSSASTSAIGGGIGAVLGPVGGLLGIGGGASNGDSQAWRDSSRNVSANSLQTLARPTRSGSGLDAGATLDRYSNRHTGERVAVTTETGG